MWVLECSTTVLGATHPGDWEVKLLSLHWVWQAMVFEFTRKIMKGGKKSNLFSFSFDFILR